MEQFSLSDMKLKEKKQAMPFVFCSFNKRIYKWSIYQRDDVTAWLFCIINILKRRDKVLSLSY